MKKELIEIEVVKNSKGEKVVTSARELYLGLGLSKAVWKRWYDKNIVNNEYFKENIDWVGFNIMLNGNETQDFEISLDFAKHIVMMARTEKSHKYRNYLIECEKRLDEIKDIVDNQGSITKEEFYEIHFKNAKRIRMSFETTTEFKELFDNFLEYVGRMDVATRVKRCEHLQKVLDDIMNERVRDLTIGLSEVIVLRGELTDMKLKLEELINETLNRSYGQQIRRAKEATK